MQTRNAKRSVGPPLKLSETFCARCSRLVGTKIETTCDKSRNKKCSYCKRFNEDDPIDDDLALLKVLCKAYDADIMAQLRVDVRHGTTKKPTSMVEVGLLLVQELKAIRGTLEGVYDVMRVMVGSASLTFRLCRILMPILMGFNMVL